MRSESVSSDKSRESIASSHEEEVEESLFAEGEELTGENLKLFLKKNFLDFADDLVDAATCEPAKATIESATKQEN